MKKNLILFALAMTWLFTSGQTQLIPQRRIIIKNRSLVPVLVSGSGSLFSFDGVVGGSRGCFKVTSPSSGGLPLDFTRCDTIVFELAENYLYERVSIPLYYIRRINGLYMTMAGGFVPRISDPISRRQLQEWLISVAPSNPRIESEPCYSFLLARQINVNGYALIIHDGDILGFTENITLAPNQTDKFFLKKFPATRLVNNNY
jgi:hypothetical protein